MASGGQIVYLWPNQLASFAYEHNKDTNDATRAQIAYVPDKSLCYYHYHHCTRLNCPKYWMFYGTFLFADQIVNVQAANAFTASQTEQFREGSSLLLAAHSDDVGSVQYVIYGSLKHC